MSSTLPLADIIGVTWNSCHHPCTGSYVGIGLTIFRLTDTRACISKRPCRGNCMPAMGLQPFGATFEIFIALRGQLIKHNTSSTHLRQSTLLFLPVNMVMTTMTLSAFSRMLPLNQNSKYQSAKYGVKNGLEATRTAVNFELVGIPYSRTRDPQQNLAQHIAGPKLETFPISGRSCTITDCQSTQLHALIRMQANETSACLSDSKSTYRTHTKAKINRR